MQVDLGDRGNCMGGGHRLEPRQSKGSLISGDQTKPAAVPLQLGYHGSGPTTSCEGVVECFSVSNNLIEMGSRN